MTDQIEAQKPQERSKTNWTLCFLVIAFGACIALGVHLYWNQKADKLFEGIEKDKPNFQKEMQAAQKKTDGQNNQ